MHEDNVLDRRLAALPQSDLAALDERYKSLVAEPRTLKFIDRLVADSRAVGLNHVAGLSGPQQVQMVLFSLFALIDERDEYKSEMKHIIRQRYHNLYRHIGADRSDDVNAVDYYTLIDLEALGEQRYGRGFADWLLANKNPTAPLARLADEGGVVLLPGQGFGTLHLSARVSLANLRNADYARIGEVVSTILDEYHQEFTQAGGATTQRKTPQ
jgi:aspartate 4-decarboxylase